MRDAMDTGHLDEATALRVRRVELDNDDLFAQNARLRASIGQNQDEIERLLLMVADYKRRLADTQAVLADTQAALAARVGLFWPARALLRRLRPERRRRA